MAEKTNLQYEQIYTKELVDANTADDMLTSMIGQRIVLPASFIRGPRDMRRRFLDAMALVQDGGKPDIFLTMTCNPKWPEIQNELLPWQKAEDRPDVVSRVFHAKIEDLKEQLLNRAKRQAVDDPITLDLFRQLILLESGGYSFLYKPLWRVGMITTHVQDPSRLCCTLSPTTGSKFNTTCRES
ncbi:hypothetical protein LXL04_014596 [Taraxacum kok-saghyz]